METVTLTFEFEGTHADIESLLGDVFGAVDEVESVSVAGNVVELEQELLIVINGIDVPIEYKLSRRYGSKIDELLGGWIPMYTLQVTGKQSVETALRDVFTDGLLNTKQIVDSTIRRRVVS